MNLLRKPRVLAKIVIPRRFIDHNYAAAIAVTSTGGRLARPVDGQAVGLTAS